LLLNHGWTPEGGFLPYRWDTYSELMLLCLYFQSSINATLANRQFCIDNSHQYQIDLGITLLMIENYRSGLVWRVFERNESIQRALEMVELTNS